MKKRFLVLGCAILLSGMVVFGCGIYLKYGLLKPIGLAQDKDPMAVPFLLAADPGLRYAVEMKQETGSANSNNGSDKYNHRPHEIGSAVPDEQDGSVENGSQDAQVNDDTLETTENPPVDAPEDPPEKLTDDPPKTTETDEPENPPAGDPNEEDDPPKTEPNEGEGTPDAGGQEEVPPEPQGGDESVDGVDDSWFDDALFIGDSRTVGLRDYARLGKADYFCTVGMSVFNVGKQKVSDTGFDTQTLSGLLASKSYGKVLICLGINECGYPIDTLMEAYSELVDEVRNAQPDAKIILQAVMTVGRSKEKDGSYFSPSNIFAINDRIAALADGETIFYIDVNEDFADEEGYLPNEMSGDGCHLYAKYYTNWVDWLKSAAKELGI